MQGKAVALREQGESQGQFAQERSPEPEGNWVLFLVTGTLLQAKAVHGCFFSFRCKSAHGEKQNPGGPGEAGLRFYEPGRQGTMLCRHTSNPGQMSILTLNSYARHCFMRTWRLRQYLPSQPPHAESKMTSFKALRKIAST